MSIFEEDRNSPYAKAFYSFISLSNKIELEMKKALKPFGMTHAQLNVLYLLARKYPKKLNPADIKKLLIVQNPDVTRLIDRLVSKNWVNRQTCPENRRKVDLSITEEGMQMFEQAHYAAKNAVGNFFYEDLEEQEVHQLRLILRKIRV